MSKQNILFLTYSILAFITPSICFDDQAIKKINNLNLLFPLIYENLDSRSIEYTLHAYNGCYEWQSSRPEYLQVRATSLSHDCQTQAVVSLSSNKPYDNIIWITAKDKESGDLLKVESKISKIHKIEILTKLRTIDVGDVQVLEVLGYDPEENVFSTLEGLKFNWKIEQNENILEFLPTKDSLIKSTEIRKKIESQHFQTDIILVKGLRTGSVKVHISINEKGYEHISDTVSLIVIERFMIWPENNIYILPKTTVNFELAVIRNENHLMFLEKIILPNKNYNWINRNETLGTIKNDGIFISNENLGLTEILVKDIRISNNTVHSYINIVEPWYMELEIVEYDNNENIWESFGINLNYYKPKKIGNFDNNWNLIKQKVYYIRAVVYDQLKNRMMLTKDVKLTFNFNTSLFQIIEQRNHEILLKPLFKKEKTFFSSKLIEVSLKNQPTRKYVPTRMIECDKTVSIVTALSIFKLTKFINLPLITSDIKPQQNYFIKAIGGSGFYEFFSQNNSIFSVDNNGVIFPKTQGKAILEVRDRKIFKNFDKIEVFINPIHHLSFPETIKESFTESNSTLDIIAFSKSDTSNDFLPFSNCSSLNFKIKSRDSTPLYNFLQQNFGYNELIKSVIKDLSNIFYKENLEKNIPNHASYSDYINYIFDDDITDDELNALFSYYKNFGVCNRLILETNNVTGDQFLNAFYEKDSSIHSDDLRFLVYNRFSIVNPTFKTMGYQKIKNEVILSFGSSLIWSFQGGPNQLEEKRSLQEKMTIFDENGSTKNLNIYFEKYSVASSNKIRKNFYVKCAQYSENDEKYSFTFNSWNEQDHQLIRPINASTSLLVSCKIPRSLQIYLLKEDEPIYDYNSAKLQSFGNIYVKNQESYYFQVVAFDILNSPFYNFSSLDVVWTITQLEDTHFENLTHLDISADVCYNCLDEFSKAKLGKYTGDIIIQAQTSSFERTYSHKTFHNIFDELILTVGYNVESDSQKYILYYHPDNFIKINLFFGSGNLKIQSNDTSIAHLIYNTTDHSFVVLPLNLGTLKLEIIDQSMIKSRILTCFIFIVHCYKAKLKISPSIFQELDYTKVELYLYDYHDYLIPVSQMKFINFTLDVLSYTDMSQRDLFKISKSQNYNQFIAQGLKAGSYRFVVYLENYVENDSKIPLGRVSNEVEVHVYERLTTIPNNLLLAPGCNCHIEVVGGPSEKAKITSNIELRTRVSEENFIKLTKQEQNLYFIEGNRIGDGIIYFELFQKDSNETLSVYEVNTKIELVNNIEINGFPERRVFLGASFRLLALMKFNNLLFTPSICPFEFFWTSNNKELLEISIPAIENFLANPKLSNYDKKILENYHIGINATAIGAGYGEIQLLVRFNYPSPFQKVERTLLEKIKILDYLTHSVQTFIRKPENINAMMILPPKTEYQLVLNKDILRYNLRQGCDAKNEEVLLEVSKSGIIKTGEKKGKVTLIIENDDFQSINDETVYINIAVTNIFSIFVENSYKLLKMPIEATSELKINYLDYYGRLFPSNIKHIKLLIHVSNTKVIDIKTNSDHSLLSIRGKMIGATLCTLYLEGNPHVFDMFLIIVDSIITPASPVYVHEGGSIQFNVLNKNAEIKEKWFTQDSSIIEINQISGKAIALREGTTLVLYKETIQYTTKIHVFKINKVILDSKTPSIITNILSSKHYKDEYKILVRAFSDDYEIEELFNEKGPINNNLKFICENMQSDWIFTNQEIHYDPHEKKHKLFCVVKLKKNYPNDLKVPNVLTLVVNFISNRENTYKFSWKFYFEIYWAFKISDSSKINLNKRYNSVALNVITPYDLDIRTSCDLIAKTIKTRYISEKNEFILNISIPSNYRMIEGSILIDNLITNQTELITLNYDPTSDSEIPKSNVTSIKQPFGFSDYLIITLIVILCSLVWLYNKNSNDNDRGNNMPGGKRFDMRQFEGRNILDPMARRSNNVFGASDANKGISTPPDLLKTPLDKRKILQESMTDLHVFSGKPEDNFHRHLNS